MAALAPYCCPIWPFSATLHNSRYGYCDPITSSQGSHNSHGNQFVSRPTSQALQNMSAYDFIVLEKNGQRELDLSRLVDPCREGLGSWVQGEGVSEVRGRAAEGSRSHGGQMDSGDGQADGGSRPE
ncbi:unnamed protein product [Pleuronectes platessa]|uniref:Uncharacterized protein n=1 Tax=Pleuronectes platessa TaxID=8262 RepID=A0A9N7U264_PLEPL|nr:unnamed protein product [Pleuronectes platessa]